VGETRREFDSISQEQNVYSWRKVEPVFNPGTTAKPMRTFEYPTRIKFENKFSENLEQPITTTEQMKQTETVVSPTVEQNTVQSVPVNRLTEQRPVPDYGYPSRIKFNNDKVVKSESINAPDETLSKTDSKKTQEVDVMSQTTPQLQINEYPSGVKFNATENQPPTISEKSIAVPVSKKTFYEQMQIKSEQTGNTPAIKTESDNKPDISQVVRPENPKVTVIIDNITDIKLLEETLVSLSRQTYSGWVGNLLCKSSSDDNIGAFKMALNKIRLGNIIDIKQFGEKTSPVDVLNGVLEGITTPYVSFCRASDLWVAKKLELQVAELEATPTLGIVGSMARYFGDKIELIKAPPGNLTEEDFKKGNPLIYSSVVMRRELAVFTNNYDNYVYECWLRNFVQNNKIINLSQILTLQRINNTDISVPDDMELIRENYSI
jgi:hypothetical protein